MRNGFRVAAVLATMLVAGAAPHDALGGEVLRFDDAVFDPMAGIPSAWRTLESARAEETSGPRIVQFADLAGDRPAQLARHGLRILRYLPDDAYIVAGPAAGIEAARGGAGWRWDGPVPIALKLEESLRRSAGTVRSEVVRVEIALWRGEVAADLVDFIHQYGGRGAVLARTASPSESVRLLADIPTDAIARVAIRPEVERIEPAAVLTRRNETTRWVMQSNEMNMTPIWDRGLHGEGQIAGLLDTAVDMDSCFFSDAAAGNTPGPGHRKVVAYYDTMGASFHGTHTAGILAGWREDGTLGDSGLAYGAKLAHGSDGELDGFGDTASTLKAALVRAQGDGAFIHSNSWGDDTRTNYTFWCRDIDEYSHENEDGVVVFAVTNTSTLKTPENAKNVLAVGATLRAPQQDSHGSGGTGPTNDGRRKPEVYAHGGNIRSADPGQACGTATFTGAFTSWACPAAAACGVLARQYFMEGFHPSGMPNAADALTPSGALLRAMLINASVDMTGVAAYPSNQEGWGRILLDRALYFDGDVRRLIVEDVRNASGLAAAESLSVTFDVGAGEDLAVTLVWTDPPAAHSANPSIVNDLNLELVAPDATTYLGNSFSGGESVSGGVADTRNTVEQALVLAPMPGTWTARVVGASVPLGPQGFALAITGNVTPIAPAGSDTWVLY